LPVQAAPGASAFLVELVFQRAVDSQAWVTGKPAQSAHRVAWDPGGATRRRYCLQVWHTPRWGAGERRGVAKLQVSGVNSVRVSGKQLHTRSEPLSRDLRKGCWTPVQQQSTAVGHSLRLSPNCFSAARVALDDAWA
jgi:hypothetical protein